MNVRHDMVSVFVVRLAADGEGHEFLQLRRCGQRYMSGTWQIIRGGVLPKETYAQAAIRELHEESGLKPTSLYRLGSAESFYVSADDTLWHSVPFCAEVDRKQVVQLNDEHDDFRWIERNRIEKETMWADERRLLRDVMSEILDNGQAKPYLRVAL